GEREAVSGADRPRVELGEPEDGGAGRLGVHVEGRVGHAGGALGQLTQAGRVDQVDRVGDEGQPVRFAPETDLAGCVARKVDYLESRDLVAGPHGSGDLDRTAIPAAHQGREDPANRRELELREVEV